MTLTDSSPFRQYVAGVETRVPLNNQQLVTYINFDNAATTPPLISVMNTINDFAPWYSSVHRGKGFKSCLSSDLLESSRKLIADFVGAGADQVVIFVKNTTEAINKLANRLCRGNKSVILSTGMEHHSNDLPWRDKFTVDYITLESTGRLSLSDLEAKLIKHRGKARLVTVCGASNVTGYVNNLDAIASLTHQYGSELLVDGAQFVPHCPINMKQPGNPTHIDYLAFSAHKMYAPFGAGVLIGAHKTFSTTSPDYSGGGTVRVVTPDLVDWAKPPAREEAGTPNLMGVVALAAAINTLSDLGMKKIAAYEQELTDFALRGLKEIPDVILYNDYPSEKVAIIPFNIKHMSHEVVAAMLARRGIAVRNGCFCAQPYVQRLLQISVREIAMHLQNPEGQHPGLVRLSFGMYNTRQEIERLLDVLSEIIKNRERSYQYA